MSDEGEKTCPLCAEEMDLTDQQLKPCKCGYEICVWCWHHIMDMAEKDETEGRCPACRTSYDKEKIVGMAANCERLVAEINSERKLKSQRVKPKTLEGRKHLSSVRVIQRNLVYIIGIPSNLADEDLLQRKEYFGQYGKVLKVSISRTAGGVIQHSANNTCSVYITYSKEEEAVRCIQSVHGFVLEGRSLRACFGTTKYCHAWLRNVPCSNPDCLYLHDIGTQEDSFTKDEIISAYTRSRVQQITGATYNLQRRSGNALPPPADDYLNSGIASSAKPIVKSVPSNPVSQVKDSPPDGSCGRSITLPAAASWGMRASNCRPSASSLLSLNGPVKLESDTCNGSLVLPSMDNSTTQTSTLHTDVGKKSMVTEETRTTHPNGSSGSPDSSKQYIVKGCRRPELDTLAEVVQEAAPGTLNYSNFLSMPASMDKDRGITMAPNMTVPVDFDRQASSFSTKDGNAAANANIQSLCLGLSSVGIDSQPGSGNSDSILSNGSNSNHTFGTEGLQQHYFKQFREPLTLQSSRKATTSFDGEQSDWRSDSQAQVLQHACGDVEEDLLPFDNHRLKVSEAVIHSSYLPSSISPPMIPNHSIGHSWQHSDACIITNPGYADPRIVHTKVDEASLPFKSGDLLLSSNYNANQISSSTDVDGIFEQSMSSNVGKGKSLGRLTDDGVNVEKNVALDMGESSIISNILSMDIDVWDESLTSPHNLAKLLKETDKQHGSIKMSSSWKAQNSNQSRFSFAREEDFVKGVVDLEPSFSNIGYMTKKHSVPPFSLENRDIYSDKFQNSFSSGILEEPDTYSSSRIFNNLSASRAQISAPPGFTVPSRAPPSDISYQEKMDQAFDSFSGNHLLESSLLRYQYQAPPTRHVGSIGDVEFIDPAILAVGKGRLSNGMMNSSSLDMRLGFPPQFNPSENDARLQLLMQQSISAHQNLRFSDNIGDRFSLNSIPSRILEQSQASNLSPFAQLSLQQSRNARIPNGQWDGWNELQTGNDLGMAELLRNERLGFNKFFPGYEDLKFRMPSSGDLYNRAFGM